MTAHLDDMLHEPETEPAGSRVPALDGRRLNVSEQAQALASDTWRAAWRRFRKACEHPGGFVHGLMSQKPPSVTEQVTYADGRPWVTAGHDGGVADVAGTGYQRFIGVNGVAWHDAMAALYARPFRLTVAVLVAAVFSVPVILALGWVPWLIITALLRVIVFPLAVTALRPEGVSR